MKKNKNGGLIYSTNPDLEFNNEKDIIFLSSLFDNIVINHSDIINFLLNNSDFKNLEKILSQEREIVFEQEVKIACDRKKLKSSNKKNPIFMGFFI